jgi:hypothetical protein
MSGPSSIILDDGTYEKRQEKEETQDKRCRKEVGHDIQRLGSSGLSLSLDLNI